MNLLDIKSDAMYVHTPTGRIVDFIAADLTDGASLIVEARDLYGDTVSGILFRTESCDLEPATRADYEKVYPPDVADNFDYAEVGGIDS